MGKNQIEVNRGINILLATEEAVIMIEAGLSLYQMLKPGYTKHAAFMLLLSNGYERLMKSILFLHKYEVENTPLTSKELMAYNHDLRKLRNDLVQMCFTKEYKRRAIAQQDEDFIKNDPIFEKLFTILADYAKANHPSGRYNFLNNTANPRVASPEWPYRRWADLEETFATSNEYLENVEEAKTKGVTEIIIVLEKFTRALLRVLRFAGMGSRRASISTSAYCRTILDLDDSQLGKHTYEF